MHVRVLLSRYRTYSPCPDCKGKRFQPEALLYKCSVRPTGQPNGENISLTLADFYQLPIDDALRFTEATIAGKVLKNTDPITVVLHEIRARLGYLVEVGLGYLTLD